MYKNLPEFYLEIWKEREHICTGCGKYLGREPLSYFFSHTIKKNHSPHLKFEKDNIELECDKCHVNWDYGALHKKKALKNFEKKMAYVLEKDPILHDKILS